MKQEPLPEDEHITKLLYIGLDVHKDSISVALADEGRNGEVRHFGSIRNDMEAVEHLLKKLRQVHRITNSEIRAVYEAGPCGFVLHRRLTQLGVECIVVSPSMIPKKAGDKIKTDRRDAIKLARLHRAGELTAINVPDETDEAIRDLCRARTDAVNDLRRCRSQLKAFLLRQGYKYRGKSSWTQPHMRYLRELVMPHPAQKTLLEESLRSITDAVERVNRITGQIEAHYESWNQKPRCEILMGFKGIQFLTAVTLISEIGEISRFSHPRQLMAYLGLVPSEYSSGDNPARRGMITKCGNHQARWFLVESAHHYALSPKVSKELSKRQLPLNKRMKTISWNAQNRLFKRYHTLKARGKCPQKAVVAVARELLGFIWAILKEHRFPGSIEMREVKTTTAAKHTKTYQLHPRPGVSTAVKKESGITPLRSGPQGALIPVLS